MLDDAISVMDAVGWSSAHVMGASMGAALAQAMALYHPERVRTLICASGVPADVGGAGTMRYIKFGVFAKLRKIKPGTTREEQIDSLVEMFRVFASPGYPFPEKWARAVAETSHDRSPRDPKSTQRQIAAGRAQKVPSISGIKVPTLVFCGRDDPIIKPQASRDIAARIPGATLVIYPGMGHSPARGAVARLPGQDCGARRPGLTLSLCWAPPGVHQARARGSKATTIGTSQARRL